MRVTNREQRTHFLGDLVQLRPGENVVDDDAWRRAKAISLVRFYVESGAFVEVDGDPSADKDAVRVGPPPTSRGARRTGRHVLSDAKREWLLALGRRGCRPFWAAGVAS